MIWKPSFTPAALYTFVVELGFDVAFADGD